MSKKIFLVIFVVIIATGGLLFIKYNPSSIPVTKTPDPTQTKGFESYSASFAIYTNGTFRIFTAPMYHNLSSDVYIEASNPNIVHVKKLNITWRDFFESLPFELNEDCLTTGTKQTFCTNKQYVLQFYINEGINQTALDQVIKPGDKLLVTYDQENAAGISQQLQSIPDSK